MSKSRSPSELEKQVLDLEKENRSLREELSALRQRNDSVDKKNLEPSGVSLDVWMRNLPSVAFAKDLDGSITYVNPAFEQLFGLEPGEILGKTDFDLYAGFPETAESMRANDRKVLKEGRPLTLAETAVADGQERHFVSVKFPVRDGEGKIVSVAGIATEITDLRATEKALQESEQRFRSAFEASEIGMAIVGRDGRLLAVNPAVTRILGYSEQELLCRFVTDIVHPEDLRESLENHEMALAAGRPSYSHEKRYLHKDGSVVWGILTVSLLYDQEGNVIYVLAQLQDVRARKLAEEALRKSERLMQDAERIAHVGSYSRDLRTEQLEWSDEVYRIFGHEPRAVKPTFDLVSRHIHPDDAQRFQEANEALISGKEAYDLEYRIVRADGQERIVRSRARLERDASGRPVRMFGSVHDITERRRDEEALKRSEKRYRELLEALQEGIWVIDAEAKTTYVNDPMARMLGYTVEEMQGRALFSFMDDRGVQIAQENLQRRKEGIQEQHEFEFLRKDGERLHTLIETSPLTDEEGIYTGAIAGVVDITRRKMLESQLLQTHKMEAVGTMAGGIAHDINNILGIIVGNTELAIGDIPDWSPALENLEEIRDACLRARDVVKQILAFSRQTEHTVKPVRLVPLIRESSKLLRSFIPSTVEIQVETSGDGETVRADPTQIHQVLLNLCANASHAMEDRGGTLEIRLDSEVLGEADLPQREGCLPGPYLRLSVRDTGVGIDALILPRIFDPYFTTKAAEKGTGMGLAVVHGIVKKHGGFIRVETEPGEGSVFHVFLPRVEDAPEHEATPTENLPRGTERVLFVDDEEGLRKLGGKILGRLGYQVEIASGGVEALETFKADPGRFDLILSDVTMPHLTGKDLAVEVLNIRPDIPVILCTGFSEMITPEEAHAMGVKGYVLKPLIVAEIAETLRRVLDGEKAL